jgi:hypothetical protein
MLLTLLLLEDDSDNELDESLLSTLKKKFFSCARDGTDAVISYVDSSTNRELQTCYEYQRTMRGDHKEQQQSYAQKELTSLFISALLR